MRVVVLGAGLMGVTTAYELQRDGHEVVVVERNDAPAMETSFANAGLIAPGHSYTWASPKAPRIMLKSLVASDQALRFRPSLDPDLYRWSARFLRNCTAERARINTTRKAKLNVYSQTCLHRVVAETSVDFDRSSGGLIYLYRDALSFATGSNAVGVLRDAGVPIEVLDSPASLPMLSHVTAPNSAMARPFVASISPGIA